jgi:hypothetical protein
LSVDSLTYAFGWSAFLCRIRFCDTLSFNLFQVNIIIIIISRLALLPPTTVLCAAEERGGVQEINAENIDALDKDPQMDKEQQEQQQAEKQQGNNYTNIILYCDVYIYI